MCPSAVGAVRVTNAAGENRFNGVQLVTKKVKTGKDVGSISNFWRGHNIWITLFLSKTGEFSKNEQGISLFTARSWDRACPPEPPLFLHIPALCVKKSFVKTFTHPTMQLSA